MSKLPNDCICLFYLQVGWWGGGVVWGRLYLINSLQKLYFQCLLKYMIICAFENSPSIPSFMVTKIVYIGYGQLKKWLLFLLPFHSCAPCIFICYCCLCQCQAVCYYYMLVPTKYHWNISFQKKCSSKYVVKNARNVTQFVTTFFYWMGNFQMHRWSYIWEDTENRVISHTPGLHP
jgi:hypothetical protein